MFSRMGADAYKKDITNIKLLCAHLQHPELSFKTIHIAGTNGKGSVSHMLAATLQLAGYKTGLYTSPHLFDFRERIKINGIMADEAFVVSFTEKIQGMIEEIQPSFFEITVAMAFQYFKEQGIDIAVVEVGLGGRLDSTNIITPVLSVITNIGWDHMNILGDSLQLIAAEKGGIIKEGIPVVVGERQAEVANVFTGIAQQKTAPLYFAPDRFTAIAHNWKGATLEVSVQDKVKMASKSYSLQLPGIYQLNNLCTVLQAVEVLNEKGFGITDKQLSTALSQTVSLTGLHGRWELIRKNPTVILEVAHNKDGMEKMVNHLASISFNRLHIVTGMVKDKDIDAILALLPKLALYYFTQAQIPRALPFNDLVNKAAAFDLHGKGYADVNIALEAAISGAAKDDLIIVCGSIFLVAEVDQQFRNSLTVV
jgi:dihydrofolate synthase / folylpolyglutamate synthase